MNGKTHKRLLKLLFLPIFLLVGVIYKDILGLIPFTLLWWYGTSRLTPDRDTHSISTKKAGVSGWLVNKCFRHHGILHSFWLWLSLGIAGYTLIGWFTMAFPLTQIIHIGSDGVSHRYKRTCGKIKRMF